MSSLRRAALSVVAAATFAQTRTTDDWKAYSITSSPGKTKGGLMDLFYLRNQITRLPNGRIQVWIKAVRQSVIKRAHFDKQAIKRLAERLITYQPPLSRIKQLTRAEREGVIFSETVVDRQGVPAVLESLQELDCKKRMYRTLSTVVFAHPRWSRSSPGHWGYVAPDTNEAALLALTCSSGEPKK